MSISSPTSKLTYEDYELFPDDGKRHELIDGEHFVTPSPTTRHQAVSSRLHSAIGPFVLRAGLGQFFAAPLDVALSTNDVVQPDLFFISAARAALLTERNIKGAPDLVVEILSNSTRKADEVVKRKLYERFGVAEYWVVDPLLETVKVYRPIDGVFQRAAELSCEAGDSLSTPHLPGLVLPLAEIFA